MKTRIALALAVLASLLFGHPAPSEAQRIIRVPCAITNPGWNSVSGCARMTWNEATGVLCWYHQLKDVDYANVSTEMKLIGQTQWRKTLQDIVVDSNWVGGCAPKRGQTGALPRPTSARAVVLQLDGRELRIPFEIVLVG